MAGIVKFGVRWNTVTCSACWAMTGIDWMPDDPVPMTPTRRPVKSTPSWGQRPVWNVGRRKVSMPSISGCFAAERQPVAMTQELRRHPVAAVGVDVPALRRVVPGRGGHPGLELDVAAQVEPVGDVVHVAEDLGLGGVALGPGPLLLELGRERVAVVHRLDVAARPGIAVPPPRPADVGGGFVALERQAELAQAVVRVEPGEAGADDDGVDVPRFGHA